MKHLLGLMTIVLLTSRCKQPLETTPVPRPPVVFTISPDSVKLNPSGYAPLSALISFRSPVVGRACIRVKGKHGALTNVEHTFNQQGLRHSIPVLGLYAMYANTIDIGILNTAGDTLAKSSVTIQTGDLPPNMPLSIIASPFEENNVAPGLILVSNFSTIGTSSPSTPYFMDAYGEIRWVLDYRTHPQLKTLSYDDGIARLRNGNYFFGDVNSSTIYEVDLLGQIINQWKLVGYTFNHNVSEKLNGNFLLTASKAGSTKADGTPTTEDYVLELDRKSGQVVTEWDLKESLDEQRTALSQSPYFSASDWFHSNSVVYDSTDHTIVVSGRHQGVVKLDYDNRVKWILGAHRGWGSNRRGEALSQYLLSPLDAQGVPIRDTAVINGSRAHPDFEWNWYQHSNIFLSTGELMVFDNGDVRQFDSQASRYSRAVSYKIDPKKKTVQQIWTYGRGEGLATYSQIISSVEFLLDSQHVVFAPGYQVPTASGKGGKVIEIDAVSHQVLSEISISTANGWGFHRAKKMSAYP